MIKIARVFIFLLGILFFEKTNSQVVSNWTNTYNSKGDNSDRYNVMIADGSGNFYLAGYTYNQGTDKDFLIAKVNSNGDTLWTRKYNHPANLADEALFICKDISGNIYVTGSSDGGFTISKNDFLTLKYNSSGTLLWTVRYNFSAFNEDDIPTGIDVDNNGNVFVTGRSDHDANNVDDIVTLKYNSSGIQQWAIRYNGVTNGIDRPVGVFADQAGGCFTGGRYKGTFDDDFITIHYSTSGVALWTATYDNGFGSDRATAFAKDDSGNVYITGRSYNGSDDDFTTIKYTATGLQQWAVIYNSGNDDRAVTIYVDGSRNVYVAGQTDAGSGGTTNYNFKTIKYNASGIQQWVSAANGTPNNEDVPESIYADVAGNVYLTGKSDSNSTASITAYQWTTIKLNVNGVKLWTVHYTGTAAGGDNIPSGVFAEANGNVFVCGHNENNSTQRDAAFIKYNSSGTLLTSKFFNGTGDFTEKVKAMTLDKNKNLYLTGYVMGAASQKDLFVQKVNASGITQWFKIYDGSQDDDEGNAIVTDTNGNVYVTGYSNGVGTYDDYITIKFNSNGDSLWSATYNFTARQDDKAVSIAVNNSGIVYVTGYSDNNPDPLITNYDYATIKYSAGGLQQWVMRYNGTGNGSDRAVKILLASAHIYVTGRSFNGLNEDVVTLDYSGAGLLQSSATYNGNIPGDDQPADACIDGSNLYVTGSTFAGTAAENYLTIKYNATLIQQWAAVYNGTADSTDRASSLTVNTSGVYVTGRSMNISSAEDMVTIKYNKSTGSQSWKAVYNGTANLNDRGNSLVADMNGNLLVAGETIAVNGLSNAILLSYNASGTLNWSDVYNGSLNGEDSWKVVCTDATGLVYTGGYAQSLTTGYDIVSRNYCSTPVASITATGPTTFCSGGQVILNANTGNGLTYQWKKNALAINGATSSSYTASKTGTFTVVVKSNGNCFAESEDKKVTAQTVSAVVTPSGPTTFCAGDSVKLTANTGSGLTYQWKKDGIQLNGYTAPFITAKTGGIYKVTVTNANGCTKVSVGTTITVNCREQNAFKETDPIAYPNPFNDSFIINLEGVSYSPVEIFIYDLDGRLVEKLSSSLENQILKAGTHMLPGAYVMKVIHPGQTKIIRLIKLN